VGTLRTIFALSVVFAHSWPDGMLFVGGQNAVELFYIISGFLISYILVESRSYGSVSTFYINRYLRLYPIYIVVAALSLIAVLVLKQPQFMAVYRQAPIDAIGLLVISNLLMFGQDWVMFSGVAHGQLVFSSDFQLSEVLLYRGLLVPQAWTLGVELSFYLIAPFVLPRRRLIYSLLLASIALRACLIHSGLGTRDPWTYRFFPAELSLFLVGVLAHQILRPLYAKILKRGEALISGAATCFLIALALVYFLIPLIEPYRALILFVAFVSLLPLAFIFQGRNRFDMWIGNLSYPIYIGHLLMTGAAAHVSRAMGMGNLRIISIASAALSVAFAILLNYGIGMPFEKVRNYVKLRQFDANQRPVPAVS
jgi:peptidoglycan/LPS O-acetylase OafA/YrhL